MLIQGKLNEPNKQQRNQKVEALKLRSDLRVGADCSEGINYWRQEYNYWKNLAQSMGCV